MIMFIKQFIVILIAIIYFSNVLQDMTKYANKVDKIMHG